MLAIRSVTQGSNRNDVTGDVDNGGNMWSVKLDHLSIFFKDCTTRKHYRCGHSRIAVEPENLERA